MAHQLSRLSKSYLEQPQLITQERFEEIAKVIENRDVELVKAAQDAHLLAENNGSSSNSEDLVETTVGVLRIDGALTYKSTGWEALCGGASYQSLIEQTRELCEMENVSTILMDVDSGGGEAYRCFESARLIRSIVDEYDKKLIAYVDGISASAAYGLTSVCDEVIMNPDAQVGSIGVVVRLTNNNEAMKDAGLKTVYITAGDSKVPFDDEGEFREDYIADIQNRVTELYDGFINHVSTFRNITKDTVRNTEAKMFSAEKALELGLVDKVMEGEEFYTYLSQIDDEDVEESKGSSTNTISFQEEDDKSSKPKMSTEDNTMSDANKTEASVDAEMVAELKATMEKQAEQLANYQAKEKEAAKATLSESLNKFTFLAEHKESVVSFLADESVSEDHKSLLNTVMDAALTSNEDIKEEAATNIADAQLAAEKAQEEKETIKEEFGKEEHASTEVPEEALSVTEVLAAKVAKKKAAKLAAKA